ncbi:MAG: excalibur calcium-binding domain-containing protein [Marmoricola sp.]
MAVKIRWSLKVNPAEKRALSSRAAHCADSVLTIRRASITRTTSSPGGPPTGTDPRFDYCYQAIAAGCGPYYRGRDPEYLWDTDNDHDGVVCES